MNKVQLLARAKSLNIDATPEMTNSEIEKAIADVAPEAATALSAIKFLLYEDGTKVEVSAKDADRICEEINDTTKNKVKVV